jgi:hypothetical protein
MKYKKKKMNRIHLSVVLLGACVGKMINLK